MHVEGLYSSPTQSVLGRVFPRSLALARNCLSTVFIQIDTAVVVSACRSYNDSTEYGMSKTFKRGDHVEWNSEAGRVRGVIIKKVSADILFKGYVHHASKDAPQYLIKSDKTDHVAIHKGIALKLITGSTDRTQRKTRIKRRTGR